MYGGTKSEMQRLLVDAEKLTGIKYDINNFSDVIQAIHAIQNEMGITGTTAMEAMSTIEGSLNMAKSAWTNMLTGIADENANFDILIDNLVESASALAENLLPRIEIALNGIGQLIDRLLPVIINKIPEMLSSILPRMVESGASIAGSLGNAIIQSLPTIIDCGVELIQSLLDGIQGSLPMVISGIGNVISLLVQGILTMLPQFTDILQESFYGVIDVIGQALPTLIPMLIECLLGMVQVFIDNLPMIIQAGMSLLEGLAQGILTAIPLFMEKLPIIIQSLCDFFANNISTIVTQGIDILIALINGIVEALPTLIEMLPTIINTIITVLMDNLPIIINAGIQLLLALIDGIVECLPALIEMLPTIITSIVNTLIDNLDELVYCALQLVGALIIGLVKAIPALIAAVPQLISAIIDTFTGINWGDIGLNIVKGIGEGLLSAGSWLMDKVKELCGGVVDGIKDFFGIHSPSRLMRDEIGRYLPAGIGVGFDKGSGDLEKDIDANMSDLVAKMQNTVDYETAMTTARVITDRNIASGEIDFDDNDPKNNPVTVIAKLVVDGKEFVQTVVAPNQDAMTEYYEGR